MVAKTKTKKESFMQGVAALMFSQVLIKLLGLIYKLYLTNKEGFGDEGNAIYSAGFQIYALLLTLSSIGVPNAIAKMISERRAIGDYKGASRIFKIAFATFAVIGLIGTCILFFGANLIANSWLQIPEAHLTLIALSPSIFFVAIGSVARGYFNGIQNMKTTANSQTLEQVFKTLLTIILVEIVALVSGANTKMMAAGANLATTLATFFSFGYLYMIFKSRRKERVLEIKQTTNYKPERIRQIVKNILMVSIPMSLSSILSSLNKNIDSFTVVRGLKTHMSTTAATATYGILGGKVDTLTSLPLSFNIAFATALVPAITIAKTKGDMKSASKKISFSLLVTMLIGLPCTVGMYIFADQILNLLFPNASDGALLLQISSLTIIFTILAQTVNGALQGLGKLTVPALALGTGVLAKLIMNLTLVSIPSIGAAGAAWGSVVCHLISFLIGYNVLKKNIKLDLDFNKFVFKPVIATATMAICSYGSYIVILKIFENLSITAGNMATILALVIAVVIYVLLIVILKIFNKEEIESLPMGNKIYKILEKAKIY
ncbi:MAG: polysaccharide biosynthesis protein [Clostridia bacterium]|nr:polysaccharide biosynthesis protein [Clostridia bacterium]